MIYVYFTLASVLWWLTIAINLFLVVVLHIRTRPLNWGQWLKCFWTRDWRGVFDLELLFIGYNLMCWVLPLIPIIIAMSAQKLGFGDTELW